MSNSNVVLEASDRLRQLSFNALADRLESNEKGTISEATIVLYEHYFYQLADRLAALSHEENHVL